MGRLGVACLLLLPAGCSAVGPRPETVAPVRMPAAAPAGVVFVANGSGDSRYVTENLDRAATEAAVPLQVVTVDWSHGRGRVIIDHVDHDNHLAQGERLAAQITALGRGCPVSLVGHSTGCAVALAAAEALPPDSIDRVVLLAPSVCVAYDLRPALRAARRGIDVFYSTRDRAVLGVAIGIVGTADRGCHRAAGQFGFAPVVADPADAALYGRLRQYPWESALAQSGNDGGHYGSIQPEFLRTYVVPMLVNH